MKKRKSKPPPKRRTPPMPEVYYRRRPWPQDPPQGPEAAMELRDDLPGAAGPREARSDDG